MYLSWSESWSESWSDIKSAGFHSSVAHDTIKECQIQLLPGDCHPCILTVAKRNSMQFCQGSMAIEHANIKKGRSHKVHALQDTRVQVETDLECFETLEACHQYLLLTCAWMAWLGCLRLSSRMVLYSSTCSVVNGSSAAALHSMSLQGQALTGMYQALPLQSCDLV